MPTIMSHAVVGVALGALTSFHRCLDARLGLLALYFVAITASHGVLDALTSGGPGVAFFAPFDSTRYFFPWRPIPVSPLASRFFSEWGWRVFSAELALIWLPAGIVALVARGLPRR
jgi:inner membrane protein